MSDLTNRFLKTLKRQGPRKAIQALFNTQRPTDQLLRVIDEAKQYVSELDKDVIAKAFGDMKLTKTELAKTTLSDADLAALKNDMQIQIDAHLHMVKLQSKKSPGRKLTGSGKQEIPEPIGSTEFNIQSPGSYYARDVDEESELERLADPPTSHSSGGAGRPPPVQPPSGGGFFSGVAEGLSMVTGLTAASRLANDLVDAITRPASPPRVPIRGTNDPLGPAEGSAVPQEEKKQEQISNVDWPMTTVDYNALLDYLTDMRARQQRDELSPAETLQLEQAQRTYDEYKKATQPQLPPQLRPPNVPAFPQSSQENQKRLLHLRKSIASYERGIAKGEKYSTGETATYKRYKDELVKRERQTTIPAAVVPPVPVQTIIVPKISAEQRLLLDIEQSANKKAKFEQEEQRALNMPGRLDLIQSARKRARVDAIPVLASGNIPGIGSTSSISRLARRAMYNPNGQEAEAFRANQIYPGDSNSLNQGAGERRQFAQQIPKGLNGQPAYDDAPTNVRISPSVQNILVPNYTPPLPSQPAQGRLAQGAWQAYVQDISAQSYATQ